MRLMIVARALQVQNTKGKDIYFDYAGIPFHYGLMGSELAYFQRAQIARIDFMGLYDEEEREVLKQLVAFEEASKNLEKGNKNTW